MKLEEFEIGLGRHGADLARWPERERAGAAALLAGSEAARAARKAMAMVEDGLAAAREAPAAAPEALLARIMADAADAAAEREPRAARPSGGLARRLLSAVRAPASFREALRPAVVCAASAAFGLWLGQSAVIADAAETLIDGRAAASGFAFDQEDPMFGAALAFLPDEGAWR